MNSSQKIIRLLNILGLGLGLACIFLSFNRASWLSALVIIVVLLFIYPKPILYSFVVLIPLVIYLAATMPEVAKLVDFGYGRLFSAEGQSSANARVVLNDAGMQMFYAKPIFGWGFDRYDKYYWRFMRRVGNVAPGDWEIKQGTSHNTYITILAETGLIGFTVYFFPILWWFISAIRVFPKLPKTGLWSQRLLLIIWLAIAFRLLESQTTDMRFSWFSIGMLWFLVGLSANMMPSKLEPEVVATVADRRLASLNEGILN
jgi:O-antigen ligase